jgi:hypothetical protein
MEGDATVVQSPRGMSHPFNVLVPCALDSDMGFV